MDPLKNTNVKKATLLGVTLTNFLFPFATSSVNIALPTIGKEFAMSAISLSWVTTAYILSSVMFLLPFGRLADIYGRKKIFLYGVITFTASSFLLGISNSSFTLILFRILQGIGGAMVFSTGVAILSSAFPLEERGRVLGINVATIYIGFSIGPLIGGILTQHLGWRAVFISMVPPGLLAMGLILLNLKRDWKESAGETFDFLGGLLYCLTPVIIMFGFSLLPSLKGFGITLAGMIILFGFIRWELRAEHPLLNVNLFRGNHTLIFLNLAAMISYSATFAVTFLLSLYLQYTQGFTPQKAGLILVTQPLVQAIFSPFAGRISDRIEPGKVSAAGMVLTAVGVLFLIFLSETTPIWYITVSLIFLGAGFAYFSSPNTNAVMSYVDRKYFGVASAILGTMRATGQALSMGIAMLIFAVLIGSGTITPQDYPLFLKSAKIIFFIFTLLCLGGVFASLASGKIRPEGN